jgi:hypothetical protein
MHKVGLIYKIIINLLVSELLKVKVKFTLEQAMNAHRGSRGIALLFLLTSVLGGGGWSAPRLDRFTPGKDPVPIV